MNFTIHTHHTAKTILGHRRWRAVLLCNDSERRLYVEIEQAFFGDRLAGYHVRVTNEWDAEIVDGFYSTKASALAKIAARASKYFDIRAALQSA